jgi:hypothetical protein
MNISIMRHGHTHEYQVNLRKPWARILIQEGEPMRLACRGGRLAHRLQPFLADILGAIGIALLFLFFLYGCQEAPAAIGHLSSSICNSSTPAHGHREKSGRSLTIPKCGQASPLSRHRLGKGEWYSYRIPVAPISHYPDGRMKIGTADAYGNF